MSWNVIKHKHYLLCLDPNQTEFFIILETCTS